MGIQPNWALLDGAAIGPALEIQESGLVVTGNAALLSTARKVRGSMPKSSGIWCYEVAYYGNDPAAGLLAVGICHQQSTLSTGTGEDIRSYAYRPADGGIYNNNTALSSPATCPATPPKTYIGVMLDIDNLKLSIWCNGGFVASVSVPALTGGRSYYPSFTVGTVTAYGLNLFVNFGQRAFAYPLPTAKGWYTTPPQPAPVYLGPVGDEAYSSATTDTPANTNYLPALINFDDFFIERTGSVYVWKDKTGSQTYAEVDVDDTFGKYGFLLSPDYRDCPIVVRQLTAYNGTLASVANTRATVILDHADRIGENTIRLYIKDKIATDERALQRRLFPPWVDKGVANRPVPIVSGAVRSVDLGEFLLDGDGATFQVGDAAISNFAVVRDRGNALDRNATPPQFVPTNDRQAIVTQVLPQGLATADVSTQGAQSTYPGAPDVLLGTGTNWDTAWTGSTPPPPGWVLTNTDSPVYTSVAAKVGALQGYPHTMMAMSSNRPVTAIGSGREFSLKSHGTILRANKQYKIMVTMWDYSNGGVVPGGGLCVLSSQLGTGVVEWISQYQVPLTGGFHADVPFIFNYKVPAGADRALFFTVAGASGQTCLCIFRAVIVEELAESVADFPMVGIGFRGYMKQILQDHGGLDPDTEWSTADCDALDLAYPGAPLGVQIKDAATVRSGGQLPMDSICGLLQTDRLGVRRFRRLVDPALFTPLAIYDETQIDYPISITTDFAQGLTQTAGCQRNWKIHGDSDLVSDETLVPPAFRTQLKRQSRIMKVCNLQLRNAFQAAVQADPIHMVFDIAAVAAAELERINRPYSYVRPGNLPAPQFVLFTINYKGIAPDYLFGDVIGINYVSPVGTRHSFNVQMNLAVAATREMPNKQKLQILGWG